LYRGINEFKKGYHPKNNIVKDKKHDLVTDSHSISIRWRNRFSQLFSVDGVSDVRQTEMHTEEPLVPEPSALEVEMATEKLKRYKSLGTGQIPVEMSKGGVEKFALISINALILFGIRQNCLRSGRSLSLPIYRKGDKIECSNYRGIPLSLTTYKILSNILLSRSIPYEGEIIVDHQ
jgi:hypothetical protein